MKLSDYIFKDWPGVGVLYCGDALDILQRLETCSVDAVVTDPPYSSGTRKEGAKGVRRSMNRTTGDDDWFGSDCMTTCGFVWTMRAIAQQSKRLLCRGGHFLSFIDWRMAPHLAAAVESTDMRNLGVLVWDKIGFGMGNCFRNQHEFVLHFSHGRTRPVFRHDMPNVLRHARVRDGDHDTEKPVALIEDLITTVAGKGEIVGDWFAGSGTTGVACVRVDRQFVLCEIDPDYCEDAKQRIDRELAQPRLPFPEPVKEMTQNKLFDGGATP